MITNDGKQIIAKFLLGQAPDFATHIVAGCGKVPLYPNQQITATGSGSVEYASQKVRKSLEFETFRVPIIARGILKEDGQDKIVIKAEAPTEQRYLLSEVGFISAGTNSVAGAYDSKPLHTFSPSESWTIVSSDSSSTVVLLDTADLYDSNYHITTSRKACFINNNSELFNNTLRKDRREPIRFYNNALMVTGSSASIDASFNLSATSYWVQRSGFSMDLSQNLPSDEIKIAISVLSKYSDTDTSPDNVRIVIDFVNDRPGASSSSPKARATKQLVASDFTVLNTGESPDPKNRYIVITKKLSEFVKDDGFSWANVNMVKIYGSVLNSSNIVTDNYFIAYDGMRFDNVSTENPLFALVGYSVMKNDSAYPIVKASNTNNFIEYRFGVGVT
jgi:hypothetical protein